MDLEHNKPLGCTCIVQRMPLCLSTGGSSEPEQTSLNIYLAFTLMHQ